MQEFTTFLVAICFKIDILYVKLFFAGFDFFNWIVQL